MGNLHLRWQLVWVSDEGGKSRAPSGLTLEPVHKEGVDAPNLLYRQA